MLDQTLLEIGLSKREIEVAKRVAEGLSNKEVANQLFVTEKTIKFHLTNIYRKMKIRSRSQLMIFCLQRIGFQNANQQPAQPQNNANTGTGDAGAPRTLANGDPILPY